MTPLLTSLGTLLDENDRSEEAVPLLRRARALAPGLAAQDAALANALLRLGRGEEALTLITPLRAAQPVNQEWICYETTALRQTRRSTLSELCDYELMVQPYEIEAPAGYANMAAFNEALSAALLGLHVLDDASARSVSAQRFANHPQSHSKSTIRSSKLISPRSMRRSTPTWSACANMRASIQTIRGAAAKPAAIKHRRRLVGEASKPTAITSITITRRAGSARPIMCRCRSRWDAAGSEQGWIKFGEPRWPTPGCGIEKVVQPKEGRLVLFPSYMWHGTIPFAPASG